MNTEPQVAGAPQVEIVVPVRNEERDLAPSVRRLVGYLRDNFPCTARVTIADNGSTDRTWAVARELAASHPEVRAVHMDLPGRGRALHAIWSASDAEVLAYMDVDLSTDLNALLPLVAPLLSGHSDLAIGTRLARGSRVIRGAKRETISRCYNLLLRATLGVGFSDAQCGFKAIRAEAARILLPLVADTSWFFDTELLVLAERAGLRIHEVPVDWIDDADSRVDIMSTALGDLRGIRRVGWGLLRGSLTVPQLRAADAVGRGLAWQLPRFLLIGMASTVAYVVLYLVFRGVMGAQAANALALLLTAVGNTAANRRLTFGVRGREGAARHQFRGLIAFGAGLALTSGALAVLHSSSRVVEVLVLVAANLAATLLRFVLYRGWVFGATPAVRGSASKGSASRGSAERPVGRPAERPLAGSAPWGPAPEPVMSDAMFDQSTGSTR
jgi:glycosyltransferase involved in cell wall biosynthesis